MIQAVMLAISAVLAILAVNLLGLAWWMGNQIDEQSLLQVLGVVGLYIGCFATAAGAWAVFREAGNQ